ncbi:hypothetical protein D3C86_2018130 [compost metagenome]
MYSTLRSLLVCSSRSRMACAACSASVALAKLERAMFTSAITCSALARCDSVVGLTSALWADDK